MAVRGVEAIKMYLPPNELAQIDKNIKEESAQISSMTSVERYKQEWNNLLTVLSEDPERIRDFAFNGDLKVSKFRSIYWALLLRVLNSDHSSWEQQREQQRKRYEKLRQEYVKNPHEIIVPDDNPLSQATQSVWNQYFSDQELYAVVRQDVIRTFPGVDFFRKTNIQNSMVNILFYYAREHPYMCYRQGMHEILAPILFVIYGDHQSFLHLKEVANSEIDAKLSNVLNPEYLESDTYSIFARLMSSIESYYRISNCERTEEDIGTREEHFLTTNDNTSEIEVISTLNLIRDKILAKEDLNLHNYLMKLDIPLHLFGIRWLRLLFGREFPLLDLLVIWDAIFADSDYFDLPNYILVAMLIRIRDKLLLSDYTKCLTFLMRYPQNVDMNLILRHALHMLMPKKFDRPQNAFIYFTPNPENDTSDTPGPSRDRSKNADRINVKTKHRVSNETMKMERQIAIVQARNAADSAIFNRLRTTSELDKLIMDGYSINSPELKRLEIKNAQTVIIILHNKLEKYVASVRKHVKVHNEELAQALDGMEELCSLLDVKIVFPLHSRTMTIDQALEADEQQQQQQHQQENHQRETNFHIKNLTGNFNQNENIERNGTVASTQPSTTATDSAQCESTGATIYEKPDNGFMFVSSRLLGTSKEIELMRIITDEKIDEIADDEQKQNNLPTADPLGFKRE